MFVVITFLVAASTCRIIYSMRQTMGLIRRNAQHEKLLQSLSQFVGGVFIQRESFSINFLLFLSMFAFVFLPQLSAIEIISSKLNDLREVSTYKLKVSNHLISLAFDMKTFPCRLLTRLMKLLHNFTEICSAFVRIKFYILFKKQWNETTEKISNSVEDLLRKLNRLCEKLNYESI